MVRAVSSFCNFGSPRGRKLYEAVSWLTGLGDLTQRDFRTPESSGSTFGAWDAIRCVES